jgi:hypothetical protein
MRNEAYPDKMYFWKQRWLHSVVISGADAVESLGDGSPMVTHFSLSGVGILRRLAGGPRPPYLRFQGPEPLHSTKIDPFFWPEPSYLTGYVRQDKIVHQRWHDEYNGPTANMSRRGLGASSMRR